jgi:hypothetical protein
MHRCVNAQLRAQALDVRRDREFAMLSFLRSAAVLVY